MFALCAYSHFFGEIRRFFISALASNASAVKRYTIYANGYVVQSGVIDASNDVTITLDVPYKVRTYAINASMRYTNTNFSGNGWGGIGVLYIGLVSEQGFHVSVHTDSYIGVYYSTEGY